MTERMKIVYIICSGVLQCVLLTLLTVSTLNGVYILSVLFVILSYRCASDIGNKISNWQMLK